MAVLTTRVQRFFHLFFLSTTSEKSFIPYKPSAAEQALKVCPVRPRVLSSWGITLLEKLTEVGKAQPPQLRKLRCALIFYFETLRKLRCEIKPLKFVALSIFFSINSAILYVDHNFVPFRSKY